MGQTKTMRYLYRCLFTDNDELASLVAELIDADLMILLTDTDGFFDGHPDDEDSEIIKHVKVNESVEHFIQESNKADGEGRGGMESKLNVAKKTAKKDIPTYIANGKQQDVIVDIVAGKEIGTRISS